MGIMCVGGCLDGQMIDDHGEYVRWHVPREMPVTLDYMDREIDHEIYSEVHDYRLEVVRTRNYNVRVYVYVRAPDDWIVRMFDYYMQHARAGRYEPVHDPRAHPPIDDRADAMRYMMERMEREIREATGPTVTMQPVDKPPVDKKPTSPSVKLGKIDFSTASSDDSDQKKLTK